MAERKKNAFGTMPWWAMALVAAAIVGIFLISFLGADTSDAPEGEAFGGTDSAATEALEEQGKEPWFQPVFEPGSGEVESGLFALQAALGAGVLGYVGGRLHERRVTRRAAAHSPTELPTTTP